MSIVHRRVFYGKTGKAEDLVNHLKEGNRAMQKHGASFKTRVLADYMTGRSDRVVAEWEAESWGEIETSFEKAMSSPDAQKEFGQWEKKLQDLIEYAEGENWMVR